MTGARWRIRELTNGNFLLEHNGSQTLIPTWREYSKHSSYQEAKHYYDELKRQIRLAKEREAKQEELDAKATYLP